LDVQRKAMENEADGIYLELTSPPNEGVEPMGVDTPLVDQGGYPRNDIDVYRARTLRNRFRVLQTDHKEIVEKIEGLLVQLASLKDPSKTQAEAEERARRLAPKPKPKYDALTGKWVVMNWDGSVAGVDGGEQINFRDLTREVSGITDPTVGSDTNTDRSSTRTASLHDMTLDSDGLRHLSMVEERSRRPFARVDAVAADSPAKDAGLREEDLIVRFGHLHADNHDRLRAIAALVPEVAGEGGEITIDIVRRPANYQQCADLTSVEEEQGASNVTVAASEQDYDDSTKWERVTLSLRPRPFSGRGLIGAHVVPFNS